MRKMFKSAMAFVSAAAMCVSAFTPFGISAADSEIFRDSFENGEGDWTGRGSAAVAVSGDEKFEGSKALYVSGREAEWNGASKAVDTSTFSAGQEYSFSVNVMCPTGSKMTEFHFTLQYNDASGEARYEKIASGSAFSGDWIQLSNTNYKIPAGASDLYIYVETGSGTSDFYIDDAVAAQKGIEISGAGLNSFLERGDVDGDGVIDVYDVIAARIGYINGFEKGKSTITADADNNGEIAVNDIVLIGQFALGQIAEFPQGERVEPEKTPFDYNANLQYKAAPNEYINDPASEQGKIVKETYTGINGQKSLNVYLPYGYDESKKYNIFYLMHGGGENEDTIFYDKDAKLGNIFDHMIQNGELEPMIIVTPTFNGGNCTAQNFYNEFRQSVIPFVEGKYSTYAESTSAEDIAASRMHRAYGGFSMGSVSTWAVMQNCLDIVGYYMPLSGDHWSGNSGDDKARSIADAIDKSGLEKDEYFIMCATGSDDIAYPNVTPQIEAMKKYSQFVYTSDFSEGNFYYMVAPGLTHWWGYVRHYVYDCLPYFFHE